MRILLISQYFPPETGATSNRMISIARGLRRAGHNVHVIAEKPNHPEGVIRDDYRGGPFEERFYEGIPVTYTWVYTHPEKDFLKRIAFYTSFMVMAVVAAMRKNGPFDVVLASSPPLFVGISGWLAARLSGAQFVFDVRDLWPDLAVAMGELGNPVVVRSAKALERFIYHRADAITAVTKGFAEEIKRMIGGNTPMTRVMNGTVPDLFQRDEAGAKLRAEDGIDDRFVVTYAGNIGICQGLPHIVEAAEKLAQQYPEVLFQFVGSGPFKDELKETVAARGLDNVRFVPRVSMDKAAAYMTGSDALLVPLAHHDIYCMFIPSKLFDSMAAGRPILLSVDGEAREILNEAEAGRYYAAEDSDALARQVQWLVDHPEEREAMGQRGRLYAQAHCTRSEQVKKMEEFLSQLLRLR